MKQHYIKSMLIGLGILILSCSKDSGGDTDSQATTPVILQPQTPVLTFPLNNEPCLDTTVVDETQSTVNFQWNTATNAISYEINLTNLTTAVEQNFTTTSNALAVTLESTEPYKWKVTAIGENGSNPAESESWRFYLPGPAEVNYTPFPPELTSPNSGSTVTPVNDLVVLQWNCSDADNDLSSYDVYIDQENATTLLQTIEYESATTALDVAVDRNVVYYWKVIAIDAEGNKSDSGVYSFRTN